MADDAISCCNTVEVNIVVLKFTQVSLQVTLHHEAVL